MTHHRMTLVLAVNKKDRERYRRLSDLGCICCLKFESVWSPCEIHHINGRTGNGNQETIGLCHFHHREGSNCDEYVSRHPWLTEFEARYGNEQDLLEETNRLIEPF